MRRGEGGDAVESSVRTRRVLIVDDEPGVRESLRMVLKEGYEPFAVGSSGEALETLAATSVDVVLLDIVMPGMGGLQLLEELRVRFPDLPSGMLSATTTGQPA